MKKLFIGFTLIIVGISGCAGTPNDVNLNVNQGQCVTGIAPGYESVATTYSQAFPINANLPATSPYCVEFTLTNNNSGENANNIQVNGYGLTMSYTTTNNSGSNTYTASLIDFNAAGVNSNAFTNTYQQISNIALFDPNNCVTTLGPKVATLYANGGSCKFYAEILNESLPIGVYPLNFTVNYTNGNSSYSVSSILNQRSNLYVGGNFPQNLAITNAQSTTPNANTFIPANSPESYVVTTLTRDTFGNVYSGDILGNVYRYSGESSNSWTAIPIGGGGLPGNSSIAALTSDSLGNVYVATARGQIYQLQFVNSTPRVMSMGELNFASSNLTSMQILGNTLYVANANNIYTCNIALITPTSCQTNPNVGPDTTIYQLASGLNTIYLAGNTQVWSNNGGNNWLPFPSESSGLPGLPVNALTSANGLAWYAGITQAESLEPSLYLESDSTPFTPLLSPTGQNFISGTLNSIVIDNAGGVFVAGSLLQSQDFAGQYAPLAYIISPSIAVESSSNWVPITGINGIVNALQNASQLTPY